MYGVFNQDDDEIYVMNTEQVWNYLQQNHPLFQNYSVTSDGSKVFVYESSAGANGKLGEETLEEFFYGFSEEGLIIRPITEIN